MKRILIVAVVVLCFSALYSQEGLKDIEGFLRLYEKTNLSSSVILHIYLGDALCGMYPDWSYRRGELLEYYKEIQQNEYLKTIISWSNVKLLGQCEIQFRTALQLLGGNKREPLVYLADNLKNLGLYQKAIDIYTESLTIPIESELPFEVEGERITPARNYEIYLEIIECHRILKDPKSALLAAKECLKEKSLECAWKVFNIYYEDLLDYAKAMNALKLIGQIIPEIWEDASFLINTGNIYSIYGEKEKAIASFTKAMSNPSFYTTAILNRALEYNKFNRYDLSMKDLISMHRNSYPITDSNCTSRTLFLQMHPNLYTLDHDQAQPPSPIKLSLGNGKSGKRNEITIKPLTNEITKLAGQESAKEVSISPSFYIIGPLSDAPLRTSTIFEKTYPPKAVNLVTVHKPSIFGKIMKVYGGDCDTMIIPSYGLNYVNPIQTTKKSYYPNAKFLAPSLESPSSYYHTICEVLPKLYLLKLYGGMEDESVKILLPPMWLDLVDIVGIDHGRVVEYSDIHTYEISQVSFIDWSFSTTKEKEYHSDEEFYDDWKYEIQSFYYPNRELLLLTRELLVKNDLAEEQRNLIIYAHRSAPAHRHVKNHGLLLQHLHKAFGDENVLLFEIGEGEGPWVLDGVNYSNKLQYQVELFRRAKAVIGPHGASLSNIMFTAKETPLIEFRTSTSNDNYFAYICSVSGNPYFFVEDLYADYENFYDMTNDAASKVVRTLRNVFKTKRSSNLLGKENFTVIPNPKFSTSTVRDEL